MKIDARLHDIPKTASLLTVQALAFSCRILWYIALKPTPCAKKSIAVKTISEL